MKTRMLFGETVVLAVIMLGLAPAASTAAEGFYIGTGFGMASPNVSGDLDDFDLDAGMLFELLHLGYNFNDQFGVGLQWGAAAGEADELFGEDVMWSQGYFGVSGRLTFEAGLPLVPYFEAGVANCVLIMQGGDIVMTSDPAVGFRLAAGGAYHLNNFYFAPELSYMFVSYGEGKVELDDVPLGMDDEFDVDIDSKADLLMLQVKVGYQRAR